MAAAYAFHLCENHPFVDGNKRAGLAAALIFLELNGISIDDDRGTLYAAMMAVSEGKARKKYLTGIFRKLGKKAP